MSIGGAVAWVASDDGGNEIFCTAEGMRGEGGTIYGRSGHGCQFEDDDGNLVTAFPNGDPLCYGWIVGQDSKASEGGDQAVNCDDPLPGVGNVYLPGAKSSG